MIITCVFIRRPEVITAIERAAQRGLSVIIDCAEKFTEHDKINFVSNQKPKIFISKFKYNWIEIFADGKEYLTSLITIDDKTLYKAQWCNDPYTSILTYNANSRSCIFSKIQELLLQEKSHSEILNYCNKTLKEFYEPVSIDVIKHLIGD